MSHVCLLSKTDQPSIFSGDTLFNAGAGNCHHGGHPEELYLTFTKQLAKLSNNTLIYPGHDYGKSSTVSITENIKLSSFFSCNSEEEFINVMDKFEKNRYFEKKACYRLLY